ncbi:MAG: GNAT family N-acetyltransferase [Anaerolineae bacterium]|nr:GNAT family N-acetyltransferase [Anaerolineae bacterium]
MKRIVVKPTEIIGKCPLDLTTEDEFQIAGMRLENPANSTLCFQAISQLPIGQGVWQLQNEERFFSHVSCPGCTTDPDHENRVVFLLGHADKWDLCRLISAYLRLSKTCEEPEEALKLKETAIEQQDRGDYEAAAKTMRSALGALGGSWDEEPVPDDVAISAGAPGEIYIVGDKVWTIRPVTQSDLDAILAVYRQCEDFLALGPVPRASREMVLKDLEISQSEGGSFCGIYAADGVMVGVVDTIPYDFEGDPSQAFISLLMIAQPFRRQGIGKAVVAAIEEDIKTNPEVRTILAGVQANNPDAIRFWDRNGYSIVGGPEEMPDQTIVYRLRKDLYGDDAQDAGENEI